MNELNVTIIEQPGEIGQETAKALCSLILHYYAEHKEEIDKDKEQKHD